MLTTEIAVLLLLLVACLSAVSFKHLRFPYTVGLVLIGFGLGFLGQFGLPVASLKDIVLSPELILFFFVPPLIFESAIHLDNRLLARNLTPILVLAGPGLVISMLIVGALLAWLTPLSLGNAMLFGALISATDPVAVIALFKEVGVAKRLTILVEGESMLNDATAIVAFEMVLFMLTSGPLEGSAAGDVLMRVVIVLAGGIMVGWLMGTLLGYAMILAKDDGLIQATVSVIVAYMTFIVAEHFLEVSGVIAVMTAGLVLGRYKSRRLTPEMRSFFNGIWEYIAFLANSLIFLLVGLSTAGFIEHLHTSGPQRLWLTIALAILAAIIARSIIVFSLIPPLNRFFRDGPIDWRNQVIIFWGGLRGAVALALVLSLDRSFADRDLLIAITLGVALFTIIACGATTSGLIRKLRLNEPSIIERLSEAQALFLARQKAVSALDELRHKEPVQTGVLDDLKESFQAALHQAEAALRGVWAKLSSSPELSRQALWLQALALEHKGYQQLFDEGSLSEKILDKLHLLVELKRDAVLANQIPPPVATHEALEEGWEAKLLPGLADPDSPAGEMLQEMLGQAPSEWMQKEQQLQTLRSQYEYDMAIFEVAEQMIEQISWLGKQRVVDATVAQDCAQAYREIREQMLRQLQAMAQEQSQLVLDVQHRIIHQGALNGAEKLLENLVVQGVISTAIAEKTRVQLEAD